MRRAGNRVRITTQLINTKDGFHLWSETYDRELKIKLMGPEGGAAPAPSSLQALTDGLPWKLR